MHTPGQEPDSPLPPIQERLAYLRPSREVLEFYRQKIAQFDGEHEELLQMLEKHRGTTEDQVSCREESWHKVLNLKYATEYVFLCELASQFPISYPSISCSRKYGNAKERS